MAALGLAGCGGGDAPDAASSTPPAQTTAPPPAHTTAPPPEPVAPAQPVLLSGTVAVGAAVANASISVRCADGNVTSGTASDATGRWSANLSAPAFPCVVKASSGSLPSGVSLHSLALGAGYVNVTPLTDLVLATAVQADPSTLESASSGALAALVSKLDAAKQQVLDIFATSGYRQLTTDVFTAEFQPVKGDAYDDLLEQVSRSLADDGKTYPDLVQRFASSGTSTNLGLAVTKTFTGSEAAAMRQLNKASLAAANGVLTVKLDPGSNPIGAFVGGGAGNKAVVQLPGFNGVKLKDLTGIEMEMKGDPNQTPKDSMTPFYLNFVVDLNCDASPLPADATLAQVRSRRRIVVFDPVHHFVRAQTTSLISTSEFSTIAITPSTPGWRIVGSPSAGLDTTQGGTGTLTTFDHVTYPNACIVDGISGDGGMFRNTAEPTCVTTAGLASTAPATCAAPYAGVIVGLGDSGTIASIQWSLKQVRFNTTRKQVFRFE